jgi:hypothetical protein
MLQQQLQAFMDGLLARDATDPRAVDLIHGGAFSAAERLSIYRNNRSENFLSLLAKEFPVIERLVGTDFFRQTGRQYLAAHPSRSGDLFHAGREFPAFLARQFTDTPHAYLSDVARLEWAYQEAMVAADSEASFDLAGLGSVPQTRQPDLRLLPHPALRLVRSAYPVVTIWQANQPDGDNEKVIDLDSGGEQALLHRPVRSTRIATIDAGAAQFLDSVLQGESLGPSLDMALAVDPHFDLSAALMPWVRERVFVGWTLAEESLGSGG